MENERNQHHAALANASADDAGSYVTGIPCNLCGSGNQAQIRATDRDGNPLRLVICQDCGLVWVDPRPSPEQEREFYTHKYRRAYKQVERPKLKHVHRSGRAGLERWQRLRPWLRDGGSLLDIGAGGGEFLFVARAAGMQVQGIEPNEGYAAHAREALDLPVKTGFYQDADVTAGSLDVVTAFHVVEHLEDPLGMIRHSHGWLRPDGVLLVEVPNVEATCQHPNRQFHRGHLYHFSPATLKAMMEKAGFEVIDTYLSPDGGNIAAIGRKTTGPDETTGTVAGDNARRVAGILNRHTVAAYLRSPHPYLRPLRKLASRIGEARAVRRQTTAAQILNHLVSQSIRQQGQQSQPGPSDPSPAG